MFKAELNDVTLFRDALIAVSEFITEAVFKAKKDGIYMTAVDPTMVVLVNFKFLATEFSKYEIGSDKEISVNVEGLLSVLKRASSSDKVTLELDKDGKKLEITFVGKSTRKFVQPLINIEDSESPEMKLDFSTVVDLQTSVLEDGIGDASIVSDTLILSADEKIFSISSKGDLNEVNLEIEKGNSAMLDITSKESSSSKFSLDYFKKIVKGGKLADVVKIEFGKDYPARLTFRKKDSLELSYVLAPRVED
ncbi:MAG: proliferating cell nuclear antigen (pcna) [Candidatus Aenigmarchaeota archaeon]|nr:proliferating cell nuclear antigen (pcna) [Candidatus Aenigmarchaeota archaeon]